MGLDMYAYKVPKKYAKGKFEVDEVFLHTGEGGDNDFCYWRKCHQLHGWFFGLYKKKGGEGSYGDFNCVPLQLDKDDLDDLLKSIAEGEFDRDYFAEDNEVFEMLRDHDIDFVKRAKEAIDEGYEVYYDSWW